MQALSLVIELLHHVEVRNQLHPMRLYGTLARGAVWSCMNHASWAMTDLARVLRWGAQRGLIERSEAKRIWTLMRMLEEPSPSSPSPPPGSPGPGRCGPDPALRTHLHVLHGLARPWQEWVTEKINRNEEENT